MIFFALLIIPSRGPLSVAATSGSDPWAKTYGGPGSDEANSVQQTSDGGFIVAGHTASFGTGFGNVWVLRLDSGGSVVWQKGYGGTAIEYANSVQQTSDGGFIVAGFTRSFGAGQSDAWLLRLDPSGNIIWEKTYGGTGQDVANSVQQTSDGGFIVAGGTNSFGNGSNAWVLRLNSSGGIVWQRAYGGTGSFGGDSAQVARQTSDGGFILVGPRNDSASGSTMFGS